MSQILYRIKVLDYKVHLLLAFIIRLIFICYGVYHDKLSSVAYTDIDYKVFTDASRHVLSNDSPYSRHTYRYTPLIAFLLIPNLIVHHTFGKILFSFIDLLVGLLIRLIVIHTLKLHQNYDKTGRIKEMEALPDSDKQTGNRSCNKSKIRTEIVGNTGMLIWLYNPMAIAIATRGNCDSISGFLVLATLYFLQCRKRYFIAGLLHGIAIHVRLYPVVYSLALFMYLSKFSFYESENRKPITRRALEGLDCKSIKSKVNANVEDNIVIKNNEQHRKTIFKKEYLLYLIPNADQLKLISGCLLSVVSLTLAFYRLYGYKFLYESYVYHLVRNDAKHNFSLYFYLQYLTVGIKNVGVWQKVLIALPKLVLLLVLSVRYGLNKYSLNFSIVTQTIVMVIYNTVLTSQYFVWIMAVLPLCVWQIQIGFKKALLLFIIWFTAQLAWLLPAYLLEFQGQNTFLLIWIQSVSLFCANIAILGRLIRYFVPVSVHNE